MKWFVGSFLNFEQNVSIDFGYYFCMYHKKQKNHRTFTVSRFVNAVLIMHERSLLFLIVGNSSNLSNWRVYLVRDGVSVAKRFYLYLLKITYWHSFHQILEKVMFNKILNIQWNRLLGAARLYLSSELK